ncbi:hypothetical protein ABWH92_14495 [Ahrensia marina]|uniref:hypothetical protein n=1 Tax=Ahrensia marina TaxID=1514904 RepID=UPI0035CEEE0B
MSFDGIAIAYYAAICGALAALAPRFNTLMRRLALGAAVGVIAATLAPNIRAALGL